jgi:hypothetical protein
MAVMDVRCSPRLEPSDPPGRSNRKARAFQLEIRRLLDEGYSLAAIRAALAAAGMRVSKSTVHREAVRRRPVRSALSSLTTPVHDQVAVSARADVNDSAARRPDDAPSGRDIAAAFFEGRITNQLLLARGLR